VFYEVSSDKYHAALRVGSRRAHSWGQSRSWELLRITWFCEESDTVKNCAESSGSIQKMFALVDYHVSSTTCRLLK
jgi:hypothetical protein